MKKLLLLLLFVVPLNFLMITSTSQQHSTNVTTLKDHAIKIIEYLQSTMTK